MKNYINKDALHNRKPFVAAFAMILAFLTVFMQLGVLNAQAAPGDSNLTVEYRYREGNAPTIPPVITQGGIGYKLLSQAAPVLESTLPIIRTYEYKIEGLLSEEDLAALSQIEGLVVTPVSIALKREVDKSEVLGDVPINDADELPLAQTFSVTSAYTENGVGDAVLDRAGASFTIQHKDEFGLPDAYIADIVYRGVETYKGTGYYEAASTYQTDTHEGDVNQYVIIAKYESTREPVYEGGGTPVVDTDGDGLDDDTGFAIPDANSPVDDEVIDEPAEPEASDPATATVETVSETQAQLDAQTGNPLVDLANGNVPLGSFNTSGVWSLLSLLLSFIAVISFIIFGFYGFSKKKVDAEDTSYNINDDESARVHEGDGDDNLPRAKKNRKLLGIASGILAFLTPIIWLLVDDLNLKMVWINNHTIYVACIFVLYVVSIILFLTLKKKSDRYEKASLA
ncbi:MAG: hypothetical protein LBN22_08090 [Clostridiales Family XIII bacterium]|jgi:hypothetical protein|nr:hypothetical protein [Clostridiales Family XIII bacterium]